MGPIIILDKSTFQSLGYVEMRRLRRHFMEALPPILALEIVGDLSKQMKGKSSEEKVRELAWKFGGSGPPICVDYQKAWRASLTGYPVPMTGQVPIDYGKKVRSKDGWGLGIDLHPINHAILRWSRQQFDKGDVGFSELWREHTRSFTLEDFEASLHEHHVLLPVVESLDELQSACNRLMRTWSLQKVWLKWSMDQADLGEDQRRVVRKRWKHRRTDYFSDFAPYANFCVRATLSLHMAVHHKLISWKSKVDPEIRTDG